MPGDLFLRSEVADALNVSSSTLSRLAHSDTKGHGVGGRNALGPTMFVGHGSLRVPLYDGAAVDRLAAHIAGYRSRRGRPRLWSDEERSRRRAAHSAVG